MENNDGNISRIWKEEEIYLFKKIRKILIKKREMILKNRLKKNEEIHYQNEEVCNQ